MTTYVTSKVITAFVLEQIKGVTCSLQGISKYYCRVVNFSVIDVDEWSL